MSSPNPDRIRLDTLGKLHQHGHGIGGYLGTRRAPMRSR
jgi:hypothetical protein